MKFIPQAPPFVMVDTLIHTDDSLTETTFTIDELNILVEDGYLTTAGLIENMAQTAAAGVGYKAQKNNAAPPVGFIGAIKNFEVTQLPPVGSTIKTTMELLQTIGNVQIVNGNIYLNDQKIASAEYKIFLNSSDQ